MALTQSWEIRNTDELHQWAVEIRGSSERPTIDFSIKTTRKSASNTRGIGHLSSQGISVNLVELEDIASLIELLQQSYDETKKAVNNE